MEFLTWELVIIVVCAMNKIQFCKGIDFLPWMVMIILECTCLLNSKHR